MTQRKRPTEDAAAGNIDRDLPKTQPDENVVIWRNGKMPTSEPATVHDPLPFVGPINGVSQERNEDDL
jgi:hypothetical protein